MLNSGNVDLAMDIALVQSDEGETLVVLGDSEHWCETVGKTPKNTKGKSSLKPSRRNRAQRARPPLVYTISDADDDDKHGSSNTRGRGGNGPGASRSDRIAGGVGGGAGGCGTGIAGGRGYTGGGVGGRTGGGVGSRTGGGVGSRTGGGVGSNVGGISTRDGGRGGGRSSDDAGASGGNGGVAPRSSGSAGRGGRGSGGGSGSGPPSSHLGPAVRPQPCPRYKGTSAASSALLETVEQGQVVHSPPSPEQPPPKRQRHRSPYGDEHVGHTAKVSPPVQVGSEAYKIVVQAISGRPRPVNQVGYHSAEVCSPCGMALKLRQMQLLCRWVTAGSDTMNTLKARSMATRGTAASSQRYVAETLKYVLYDSLHCFAG